MNRNNNEKSLNIVTLNANGLINPSKKSYLYNFIENNSIDFILIQETNQTDNAENFLIMPHFTTFYNPGPHRGSGLIIAHKNSLYLSNIQFSKFYPGYGSALKFTAENRNYLIINIYIPHDQDLAIDILFQTNSFLETNHNNYIIFGGDFNCTIDSLKDRHNGLEFNTRSAQSLNNVVIANNFHDAFRVLHPNLLSYSRVNTNRLHLSASRIDRFYVSNLLKNYITEYFHKTTGFSDHKAVFMKLNVDFKSQAHWSFDNNLLHSKKFQHLMQNVFRYWKIRVDSFDNISQWWDFVKKQIQIETSDFQNKANKYTQNNITEELNHVERLLLNGFDVAERYNKLRLDHENYIIRQSIESLGRKSSGIVNDSNPSLFFKTFERKQRNEPMK